MTTQVQDAPVAEAAPANTPNTEAAAALDLAKPAGSEAKADATGRLHGDNGRFVAKGGKRNAEEQAAFDAEWTKRLFGEPEPTLPSLAVKEAAKLEEAESDEQEQPEADSAPEKTTAKNTAAYTKAAKVLELEGYEKSDLDKLGEERVIALAAKRSKVQSDVSAKLQRLAEFEKQPAATASKEPQAKVGEPAAQGLDFAELAKPFADEYGEEAGKALTGIAKTIHDTLNARVQRAEEVAAQFALREARAELREVFPDLADDSVFERAVEEARFQVKTGRHSTMVSLLDAACKQLELKRVDPTRAPDNSKARRNGRPMAQNQGQPQRMQSKEERSYNAFLALDGNVLTPDVMANAIRAGRGG